MCTVSLAGCEADYSIGFASSGLENHLKFRVLLCWTHCSLMAQAGTPLGVRGSPHTSMPSLRPASSPCFCRSLYHAGIASRCPKKDGKWRSIFSARSFFRGQRGWPQRSPLRPAAERSRRVDRGFPSPLAWRAASLSPSRKLARATADSTAGTECPLGAEEVRAARHPPRCVCAVLSTGEAAVRPSALLICHYPIFSPCGVLEYVCGTMVSTKHSVDLSETSLSFN